MQSKQAKTPPINPGTTFLCFDLETNGLHGQAFAIGAVVIDMQGAIHDEFTARTEISGDVDEWVREHVLPAISDMPFTHKNYEAMREDFWKWFVIAEEKSDYTLVSNGYPVEYRFLLDCQEADLETRYWQHPFPIIDVSSLLLGAGKLADESKSALSAKVSRGRKLLNHHPLHDATKTALLAIEALDV